jgi:gliding motility-associated-like protein
MKQRIPAFSLRLPLLLGLLLLKFSGLSGQSFYQLYGPQFIQDLCRPYTYTIESNTQIFQTDWELIPSNGSTLGGSLTSVDIVFPWPGTFILIATSTTIGGELLSDSLFIQVVGQPAQLEVQGCTVTNDKSGCRQVCAHSTTIVNDPNCGNFEIIGADSYHFIPPCGVEITWGAGGTGSVSTFSNCPATVCFEILPEPLADFTTTPSSQNDTLVVCKNKEIVFTNTSLNGLTYSWNFGDGELSTTYDATHAYASEGFYTVLLSAQTVCGCNSEKQVVVQVLPEPAPTLDCINTVCPESRQRYTATTDGCTQFTWTISANGTIVNGGGSNDAFIEIIWHDGPDGFINLAVANCNSTYCSFSNTFRIPIVTPDGPVSGDPSVCSGEVTNYSAPNFPGTQYQWQIGPAGAILGGQNTNAISVRWNDVNVVTNSNVSVQYDNCFLKCSGSANLNVAITPEITMTADVQVCQDDIASAHASAGFVLPLPASVSWHIEDASGNTVYTEPGLSDIFSHAFTYPAGEYFWVATNSSPAYCTELLRQKIVVTSIPLTPLGIKGDVVICPGQPFGYTIDAAGNFATLWSITDGSNTFHYQGQSCQHTFGPTPPYIVSAVHADIQFSTCTSAPVSITLHTISEYTITGSTDVCFNGINSFSIPYVSGSDYTWEVIPADHGEIKKSNLNEVEVFWTQSGPCTMRLHSCSSIVDKPINVHPLPAFNLAGPLAACSNEQVTLSTDQPLFDHVWKNESAVAIGTQNNIALSPGSYSVEVTDALGCADEKSFTITTYPAPVVHVSCTKGNTYCTNIPGGVDLVANTDGSGYTFLWYKDGLSTGSTGPIYNVTDFAAYHVEVTNQYGCKAISPDINFTNCCTPPCGGGGGPFPGGCTYLPNDFLLTKTETECQVHEFTPHDPNMLPGQTRWVITSISDGIVADITADILNYSYSQPGYYFIDVISLLTGYPYTATLCGHGENFIDTVRAVADFKHEGVCVNSNIAFKDLTTFLPGESIAGWYWDFDDPASGADNTSTLQNPTHIFSSGGDYTVKLNVMMMSGCLTSRSNMVHISEGPLLTPLFEPIFCELEAHAMVLPGQVFDIDWNFGDSGSGIQNIAMTDTVFHTYSTPGLYTTTVSASDIYTCRSTTTMTVDIRPNTLSGLIDVDPLGMLCFGDTAVLTAPPVGVSWTWSTGESTSQINVTETNQYDVLIEDALHCTYSPPPVFVAISPKPDLIIQAREILGTDEYGSWQNALHLCKGTEFEISAFSSTAGVLYHWSTGSTTQVIQFTDESGNLPNAGTYDFSLFVIDAITGCMSDTASIVVEIFDLPQIPVITLTGGSGCSFDMNTIQVTNPEAGVQYVWSDGQTGTSITTENAGPHFVTAINAHGCTSQSGTITINPAAPIVQIPGGCHIECDPLTVCLPPLQNVTSWSIFQNGTLFNSGTIWPSDYLINTDGSYTIEVTTSNGCTATSDPLDIILYTGVGSITVLTYLDVDHDGLITAADMLLSGIPVEIISDDGLQAGMTYTLANGEFVFEDYPANGYIAYFNPLLLSSQWKIVIDSVQTNVATCGDSVIVSLLLEENCIVSGPNLVIESCPGDDVMVGDSIWSDTGQYTLHIMSVAGCDSVFTVDIQWPDSLQIGATVWVDVDQNGVLSPADTVIQGVTIILDPVINHAPYLELTDSHGSILGEYPSGHYIVSVDSTLLPPGLLVLYGEDFVPDTACGMVNFNFLLTPGCVDVFLVQQEEICEGDSVLVQGQWITQDGMYSFLLSQPGSGCDTTLDVFVTVLPAPSIQSNIEWDCIHEGSITLSVSGIMPFQYFWNPAVQGDSMLTDLQDGSYEVTITDGNGCKATDTFSIQSPPQLSFNLSVQHEIFQGDSVEVNVTGNVNEPGLHYQWSPSTNLSCPTCPTTWAYPDTSTTYSVVITSADSCVYELYTFINVTFDSSTFDQIYIPNVFSPNGDGINDYWRIYSRLDNTFVNTITIFDRWGSLIFQKENYSINTFDGWDGTFRGKPMQPGVFAYVGTVTLGDGTRQLVKGNLTLVR